MTGTALAAAAMAALTASQAPGPAAHSTVPAQRVTPPPGPPVSGDTPYYTDLPPLVAPDRPDATVRSAGGGMLPVTVLAAYRSAEAALAHSAPGCHLRWQLLAAIGQVESAQARGGRVDTDGTTTTPILGPRLNGHGYAALTDTDHGTYDGDPAYDRAVGPMQFIPTTWTAWGADGNGDGQADPHNVFDAALAAAHYLCGSTRDLTRPHDLDRAILGYNHSTTYLHTVKSWYASFLHGHHAVPDSTATGPYPGPDSTAPTHLAPAAAPAPAQARRHPAAAGRSQATASSHAPPPPPAPTPRRSPTAAPARQTGPALPSGAPRVPRPAPTPPLPTGTLPAPDPPAPLPTPP